MNPEERMRRFNDPAEWSARLTPRADAFPARRRMSPWAVSLATVAAIAVVVAVVFAAFGLGVQGLRQPAAPPALTSNTPTAGPTATPTAAPPISGLQSATCTNVLDASARASMSARGYELEGKKFQQQKADETKDLDQVTYGTFAKYGGIICGWAQAGASELAYFYAFGPITSAQATDAKSRLAEAGATVTSEDGYQLYSPEDSSNGTFGFANGYWALSVETGAADVLPELMRNGAELAQSPDAAGYSGPATCTNLLDAKTIAVLKAKGFVDASEAYQASFAGMANHGGDLAKVLEYGGIVCAWAPGSDSANVALAYGYGDITAEQAAGIRAGFNSDRSTPLATSRSDSVDFYTYGGNGANGDSGGYAFEDSSWAVAVDTDAGVDPLPQIMRNGAALTTETHVGSTDEPAQPAKAPYLTSEGLGDLRIGQKIPSTSTMATYSYFSQCKSERWHPTKKYGDSGFTVLTKDRTPATPLVAIILYTDTIPTKSGIRVGDSLGTLFATYPKFDEMNDGPEFATYVIKGSAGQVIFEVTTGKYDFGNGHVVPKNTVAAIVLAPISVDVSQGFGVFSTDAVSPCGNA